MLFPLFLSVYGIALHGAPKPNSIIISAPITGASVPGCGHRGGQATLPRDPPGALEAQTGIHAVWGLGVSGWHFGKLQNFP